MLNLLSRSLSFAAALLRRCLPEQKNLRLRPSSSLYGTSLYGPAQALEVRVLLSNVYVSPNGVDNNAGKGDQSSPYQTLQFAANHVKPGDQVIVEPGTYAGFELTTSGTAANRITFQAQPGVTINTPGPTGDDIDLEGASFVTIEGFTTIGASRAGIRSVTNQGVIIQNNDADQNNMWGIFTAYSDYVDIENNTTSRSVNEHGIYVSHATLDPVIRNNDVWGNNINGIHINSGVNQSIVGAVVEGNVIHDNGKGGGSGISCDGLENSTIENNLLYNNHFFGISLYHVTSTLPAMNNVVQNNTVVMAADGFYALNIRNGSINNTVENNIFSSMLMDADSIPGYVANDNAIDVPVGKTLYLSADSDNTRLTLPGWQHVTGQDANSLVLTPDQLFQDPAAGNYLLNPASPLQGIGYTGSTVGPQTLTAQSTTALTTTTAPQAPASYHFQFGSGNPVASGYTLVTPASAYSAAQGYGWQSGTVSSRYDMTTTGLTPIQLSYDFTSNATFAVDLANGTYNVTVTMGDDGFSHDQQGVFLLGTQVDSVTTAAGRYYIHTYSATVTNGQLTLTLQDLGGADPNVVINALDIVQSAAAPAISSVAATATAPVVSPTTSPVTTGGSATAVASAIVSTLHFAFGTPTSPTVTGYTAVNEATTYSAALGYGWQSGIVSSRDDTAPGLTAVEDQYDYTKAASFAANLPNGTYNVTVTMGDSGFSHDLQGVFLQATQVDSVTTAAGQFYTHTYSATVSNGQLVLNLQDLGGSDPNVVISSLDIVQTAAAPAAVQNLHFAFGTQTSPTVAGYTSVNEATTYSTAIGYGWQSGTISSRDDTALGLTAVEDQYDYTRLATFAVDLANGTYNVTVTMGDSGFSHDLQGVFLQGIQVDSVTTAAGQFYTHTYSVTVTNGQLTLTLQDLGGADPNVVLNALDIVRTT